MKRKGLQEASKASRAPKHRRSEKINSNEKCVQDSDDANHNNANGDPNPNDDVIVSTEINALITIPLVATAILKNLEIKDLLHCSLVNKLWAPIIRNHLRDSNFTKCLIRINGSNPCKELQKVNNLLSRSFNHLPPAFNGLYISPSPKSRTHKCLNVDSRTPEVSKLYALLFSLVSFKHLHLNWDYDQPLTCPAAKVMEKILTDKVTSASLQSIVIDKFPFAKSTPSGRLSYRSQSFKSRKLNWPKLTSLTLPRSRSPERGHDLTDKELVYLHPLTVESLINASPKLSQLSGNILPSYLDCLVSSGKVDAIREYRMVAEKRDAKDFEVQEDDEENQNIDDNLFLQTLAKFIEANPKNISKLSLSTLKFYEAEFVNSVRVGKLKEYLVQIFENIRLSSLEITCFDLHLLDSLNLTLTSVENMIVTSIVELGSVHSSFCFASQRGQGLPDPLKDINWGRLCPNLKSVTFDVVLGYCEDAESDVLGELLKNTHMHYLETRKHFKSAGKSSSDSVTKLRFNFSYEGDEVLFPQMRELVDTVVKMFPQIKSLTFDWNTSANGRSATSGVGIGTRVSNLLRIPKEIKERLEILTLRCMEVEMTDEHDEGNESLADDPQEREFRTRHFLDIKTLDDYFTGLTSEEIKAYKRKDYEAFDFENKSRLRDFKNLKLLRMEFAHGPKRCSAPNPVENENKSNNGGSDSESDSVIKKATTASTVKVLSELTGQCVFARMPDLKVEIWRNKCCEKGYCCLDVDDLEPFVKFVDSTRNWQD